MHYSNNLHCSNRLTLDLLKKKMEYNVLERIKIPFYVMSKNAA